MNLARKLFEEYKNKVKILQESCPHLKTELVRHSEAPSFVSSNRVRVCLRCDKVLDMGWGLKKEAEG